MVCAETRQKRQDICTTMPTIYPVMELQNRYLFLRHIAVALAQGLFITVVLPLIPAFLFVYPLMPTLALIGSGFLIEYGAAPVGIALGLTPLFVFWVLMCTEIGIFLFLFGIFDSIGQTSPMVAGFLEKARHFVHRSSLAERYGILGLIPCEIVIGVYANAPVSWVLGWNKYRSLAFTMIGYLPSLALTILATIGLIGALFPGLIR
jgi:uncharacterized membrane protein